MTAPSHGRLFFYLSLSIFAASCTSAQSPAAPPATAAEKSSGIDLQFGVAVKSGDKLCLSLRGKPLAQKTPITLVNATAPQSAAGAIVVEKTPNPCPGIKEDQASYANYELRLTHGSTVEENMPLIAAVSSPSQFQKVRETIEEHLRPGTPPLTFHACTSADGVHLTAWQGKPLQGKRVWHQYYYLGQDLEANCTTKETAQ